MRKAVAVMLENYEVCCGPFHHGFDWGRGASGTPQDCLSLLPVPRPASRGSRQV